MKKWNRYVPAIIEILLGVFNLITYFVGSHNPFSLFVAGLLIGLGIEMLSSEFLRGLLHTRIGICETHIDTQRAYIEQLEKILNDVANGRATVSAKPIKSSQKVN